MGSHIKKTQEEFEQEVYELYKDEYKVIGEYKGASVRVELKHMKCGREYDAYPSNFINGVNKYKCPRCNKGGRKNHSDFLYEVNELVGDEYTVISEYKDRLTHVDIKHNVCNNISKVIPMNFIKGSRCKYCADAYRTGRRKNKPEEFKERINKLYKGEFEILTEYKGSASYITVRHVPCGETFEVTANNLLMNGGCRTCANKNMRKTDEQFKKEVYVLVGDEYTFLGEYVGSKKHIKVCHNECGHEWEVVPNSFLGGSRCPKCSNHHQYKFTKKTDEQFTKEVYALVGDEFTFLDKYEGATTRIRVKHNTCGTIRKIKPSSFLTGTRCHICG